MRALGSSAMAKDVAADGLQRKLKDAVKANDIDEAKKCVDDGGHPDTICDIPRKGSSVLSLASYRGYCEMVSFLASCGANVEHIDTENELTPFLEASIGGHVPVIRILIQFNCNTEARTKTNNGALALACLNDRLNAVKFLVDVVHLSVKDKHQLGQTPLHMSAVKGHTDVCEFLLQREANIESLSESGATPYFLAANFGHVSLLKLLQQWRCNTSARHKTDNGALALACLNGCLDAVKFLVDVVHLSVNEKHQYERTALQHSAGNGHADVCEFLLQREAELESLDENGCTSFLLAANFGRISVLTLLQQWRCNTSTRNKVNNGALALACLGGHLIAVKFLVDVVHLSANDKHQDEFIPLHSSAHKGHANVCDFLLERGAEIENLDKNGNTPFLLAATFGHVNVLKLLQQWKCNTLARNKKENGALALSARKGHLAVVEFLVKQGSVINEQNLYLRTALHLACRKNHVQVAEFLVSNGANMNIKDKYNKLPLECGNTNLQNILERQQTDGGKAPIAGVLDSLGPEGRQHFLEAIDKGTMKIARVNLDVLGDGEAGKSSLGDSLMDEPFIEKRESTEGANVIYMIKTATGYSINWKKDENRSRSLGQLLARGSVLAHDVVNAQSKASESSAKLSRAESLSDTRSGKEDINTASSTVEELQSSSSKSVKEELIRDPSEDKQAVVFGEKEFQKAKELTEERAKAIKSLQDDPGGLQKQNDFLHISVCDRGGQEHFLPIHTALIANCSEFIPKAYLLVFDLTKRLGDIASATFRARRGAKQIIYTRLRQTKNEEIIGHWASAVDLAHPESEMQPGKSEHTQRKMRPYLGQDRVRRGPAMFIIGTHYDQIVKRGEEGQELVKEQEVALQKILSKHKYIERVIVFDDKKNELIFKVDNTRSGTSNPDPMVNTLRKLIFDMAVAYRDQMKATPLPYVVLELGLLNLSQPEGPDSVCDSDQKITDIKDIVQLAERYCDIQGQRRCQTALRYLSSVGVIFYFFKAFGLTDKVFTDPQWLFDVMSTFVTILGGDKVSPLYLHDLKQLKEEGRMSRHLAEHLLERRQELGVKAKHYNTIFRLLQLVDIFCPARFHQSSGKLAVDDAKDFYVPCMLEIDYAEPTAWELSGVADAASATSNTTCHPPSLIIKPENVDSFPESLFFRLSSRTAYQFPDFPQLKRNRIQVDIDDSGLELELLYHPSSQYVIATIFPSDKEEPPTTEVVNKQCTRVRRFLCWQLNDAKRNGMEGFQYRLHFQVGKTHGTMDVDEDMLYLLPDCNEMPKKIVQPKTRARLNRENRLAVEPWYISETPECGDGVQPTKSELVLVAESVHHRWMELARTMVPRPFYRNELIRFEEDTDESEIGNALRMLQEWQHEHKDQATISNLKRSLAASNFTHVIERVDDEISLRAAGPLNDCERGVKVCSVERSGFGQPARSDLLHFPDTAQQEALFGEPQVGSQLMGNKTASAREDLNVEVPVSDTPDLELVLKAVVKCAPNQWYSIAVELGFSEGEIEANTYGVPSAKDKLQKVVRVKADAFGRQATVCLLLKACENIPNPVIGAVNKILQQLRQR